MAGRETGIGLRTRPGRGWRLAGHVRNCLKWPARCGQAGRGSRGRLYANGLPASTAETAAAQFASRASRLKKQIAKAADQANRHETRISEIAAERAAVPHSLFGSALTDRLAEFGDEEDSTRSLLLVARSEGESAAGELAALLVQATAAVAAAVVSAVTAARQKAEADRSAAAAELSAVVVEALKKYTKAETVLGVLTAGSATAREAAAAALSDLFPPSPETPAEPVRYTSFSMTANDYQYREMDIRETTWENPE